MTKIKLRSEVETFAEGMEQVLQKHDHKGGWKYCSRMYLLECLEEEVRELRFALIHIPTQTDNAHSRSVRKEAIDVANFAMMIADVYGSV